MRVASSSSSLLAALACSAFVASCGSEPSPAPAEDGGDGKYHPPANGQHTTETAACNALASAFQKALLDVGCVGTSATCPGLLRSGFTTPCMEYDQGSVDGCIAYYQQQTTCQELLDAPNECVVTPYPGTEPKGCP